MKGSYDFKRLIKKYSADCKFLAEYTDGSYVGGEWVPAPNLPPEDITGAVVPMTDRKIFQSGGTYTEQDREFITFREISLETPHWVVYKGMKYLVMENSDYSDYAGFYAYNLKRVGAFDRPGKD